MTGSPAERSSDAETAPADPETTGRTVGTLESRLATLGSERDAREARIADQARELAAFARELARAQDALEAAWATIAERDRELGEERGRSRAYAESTSWRLTAPLRHLVNRVRR